MKEKIELVIAQWRRGLITYYELAEAIISIHHDECTGCIECIDFRESISS